MYKTKSSTKKQRLGIKKFAYVNVLNFFLISSLFWGGFIAKTAAAPPPGSTTTPYTVSYSAQLADPSGVPITTSQNIRFSLWSDADFDSGDLMPDGSLNSGSAGYSGWQEVHAVTPDANGIFEVQLGSITTFPNFNSQDHVFLQIEIKPAATADTDYEVLDPDGSTANTEDRHLLHSAPFSINADTVDNADVGTGPGNIPVLDGGSQLPISTIPGATNAENFTLDNDNTISGAGSIELRFGDTLGKILEYNSTLGLFHFNDDLDISGNLTLTGTVNGVTIDTSTVGPYNQSIVNEPIYTGATIQSDGTDNQGKLEAFFIDSDGSPGNDNFNYYLWTTEQASLQDMDLIIRFQLPTGFTAWQAVPLQLTYRTEDGVTVHNKLDVTLEDTTGTAVSLNGATDLVSPAFTTADITFGGSPTFTAGESVTVKIKLSALNEGGAYAGKLTFHYIGR